MDEEEVATDTHKPTRAGARKHSRIAIVGLVLGLIALAAAALSPWAVELLEPAARPVDEVAVDVAGRIRDRVKAKMRGEQYVAPPAKPAGFQWSKWYPAMVVAAGIGAACIGIVGFARERDARLNGTTIAVGGAAVAFQYMILLAGALLLLLLVGLVLSFFDA